jgi:hypothetical protein
MGPLTDFMGALNRVCVALNACQGLRICAVEFIKTVSIPKAEWTINKVRNILMG